MINPKMFVNYTFHIEGLIFNSKNELLVFYAMPATKAI